MNELERHQITEEAEHLAPGLIHEMRQPLMGILAALELLARAVPEVADASEWQLLADQAARLDELFRTYQSLFSGAAAAPAPFAVDETVRRAVSLLNPRLRKLGARFSLESAPGPLVGIGSSPALVHAVTNLLSNALDALDDGGKDGRVQVRIFPRAERVEIRVSDEGVGIPEGVQSVLFQPRFTTKAPGRGTGLGLHLARTAMRRAGGGVRLVGAGEPGRAAWARTEFVIELPAAGGGPR